MSAPLKFRPSKMYQYSLCFGSAWAQKDLPDTTNEAAEEGTMLHEKTANKDLSCLSQDQIWAVEYALNFTEKFISEDCEVYKEVKMRLIGRTGILMTGTADCVIVSGQKAVLIDYKFGRGEVDDAADNIQLAIYSVMVMQKFGVDEVQAFICQPRVKGQDRGYSYTGSAAIINHVENIISQCTEDAPRTPGQKQCQYCKFADQCPEYNAMLSNNTETLAPLKVSSKELTIDEIFANYIKYVDAIKELEKWRSSMENAIKREIMKNGPRNGIDLKPGRKSKTITDVNQCFQFLSDAGIDRNSFMDLLSVSSSKVENLWIQKLAERTEEGSLIRGEKKRLTEEYWKLFSDIVEVKQGSSMIVIQNKKK